MSFPLKFVLSSAAFCLSVHGSSVLVTPTPILAPFCLSSHCPHPILSNLCSLYFETIPRTSPLPTFSVAAIALSHLGYCHGLLGQILPLPHLESCSVFSVSFGIKSNGLQSSALSPRPLPLCPDLLSPLLHAPASWALLATTLVSVLYLLFFFF